MRKTYRFIKKDFERQRRWKKFMRIFKAYPYGVRAKTVDKIMQWK